MLRGLRIEPDELVAEIEQRTEKLDGALGSLDVTASHLQAARGQAGKAAQTCDQSYLQVKATTEAVCRLGGQVTAAEKYAPPSLRKLQRSKKRKKGVARTVQVVEVADANFPKL